MVLLQQYTPVVISTIWLVLILFIQCVDNVQCGWIDPDTKDEYHSTIPLTTSDQRQYQLVFSDEFEKDGRSFKDGEDSRWTALDKNDYTNDALHFYKSENAMTMNGVLNITTILKDNNYKAFNETKKKYYVDTKHVQSAMVQGWNKFCMTGGIIEYSAKLPGKSSVGGLWPALWLLGNLARATYVGSSDWVWPFSYDVCDSDKVHQQEVNACRNVGHYGLAPGVGRGAPEIDILEAMGGEKGKLPNTPIQRPYFSSSYQVAPGFDKNRPILMHQPKPGFWYEGLEYGDPNTTSLNPFFYGVKLLHNPKEFTYQSDAISANTQIDSSYFKEQNIYRVEWEPPTNGTTGDGYIKWYLNGKFLFGIAGQSLNVTGAKIPDEPMYLIMNTAVASSWGFPVPCPENCDCSCFECGNPDCDCALPSGYCDNFPASFEIEYVRVYQAVNETKHQLGCSTEERPTSLFIKGHQRRYMEEGDKVPLQPLRVGGGKCDSSSDCGGSNHGSCMNGLCKCTEEYAGSTCLSHFGFDDYRYEEDANTLPVSPLSLPGGLITILIAIGVAFVVSFVVALRERKSSDVEMKTFDVASRTFNRDANGTNPYSKTTSYGAVTESSSEERNRLTQPEAVSYCLIDGRLIDK